MSVRAREFRFSVDLRPGEDLRTEEGAPLGPGPDWTPEHLLLGGLIRCSLTSLRYHAGRAGMEVRDATGTAKALFTKREGDGRYAATETEVSLDLTLSPRPSGEALADLLAKAERDCFVGASLATTPSYAWHVR